MTKGLDRHVKGRLASAPGGCGPLSQLLLKTSAAAGPSGGAPGAPLFDHFFNLICEPLVIADPDGQILAANEGWHQFLALPGVLPTDCKGAVERYTSILSAAASEDQCLPERFAAELQAVLKGDKAEGGCQLVFSSGEGRRVYQAQLLLVPGLNDPAVMIIHRDITLQYKLEGDCRESHNLFQKLLGSITNGVFLYDLEGRVVMANGPMAEALGLQPRDLIGRTIFEVYKPEMAQTVQEQNLLVLTTGQTLSFEMMVDTPWGLRNFQATKGVYRNHRDEIVGVLGVIRDVTDGMQVIQTLEKSERHFRALIENGGDRVGLLDANGTVIYASPSTKRILGYEIEELIGTDAFLWVHPQDRPSARQRFKELLERPQRIVSAQYRVLHKSGVWMWMEATAANHLDDPAIRAIVLNERDIMERKKAEAELVGFSQIIESSNDAILSTDLGGNIMSWNPAATRIFGYSEREVLGKPVSILMSPGSRRQHLHLRQAALRGEGVTDYELQMLHQSGRRINVSLSMSPLRNESRVITGCAKIIRDITERRRLEREILEISDREKQRLGQDLHDDLCQHLVGISMISNILADQLAKQALPQANEARNIADLARHAVDHARSLARGLSPLRLDEDGLVPQMALLVSVTERLFRVPCCFEGDVIIEARNLTAATHFYRIMQEALHNAVKHSQATKVCVRLTAEGNHFVLTVADNGVGMGNAETDSETGEGSGLGMHTMQYRARVLGANLEFRENPGGGTVVSCSVPRRKLGA